MLFALFADPRSRLMEHGLPRECCEFACKELSLRVTGARAESVARSSMGKASARARESILAISSAAAIAASGNPAVRRLLARVLRFWAKALRTNGRKVDSSTFEFCEARGKAPAEYGGIDVRRRGKRFGRKSKKRLGGAVDLHGDGEQPIVAGAGLGGDAVGYFALNHDDRHGRGSHGWRQVSGELRSDPVGQVATTTSFWPAAAEAAAKSKFNTSCVEDGNAAGRELGAEMGGEAGVQLDGENMGSAGSKRSGDGASAGADFYDSAASEIAQ